MPGSDQNIGFFKISRHLLNSEIMDKPPLHFKLWIWMIARASYRNGDGLQRGQFRTTIREMQQAMGHRAGFCKKLPTIKEIRCAYTSFADDEMITINRASCGMTITILNYNKYQNSAPGKGTRQGIWQGTRHATRQGTPKHQITIKDHSQNDESKNDAQHTAGHTAGHAAGKLAGTHRGGHTHYRKNIKNNNPPSSPPQGGKGVVKGENVEIPSWIPPELWVEFKKHRSRLKAPMTPYAEKRAISRLTRLRDDGNDPKTVINQSIECGWKGFFEVKTDDIGGTENAFRQFLEEHRAAEHAHRQDVQ